MQLELAFRKTDFVKRYKKLCKDYNDYDASMRGSQKKVYSEIIQKFDDSTIYLSKEKCFKSVSRFGEFSLELLLTLHGGLVEVHLNSLKGEQWLTYNRFDGYAEELDSSFNRELYNIPKYASVSELEEVLKEIFLLYSDIKNEVRKQIDE